MKLTPSVRAAIDEMTYEELLRKRRFALSGDSVFEGETGDYFERRISLAKRQCPDHAEISKKIGWKK